MSKSILGTILEYIDGTHCMGVNVLGDYHAARLARNALRRRDPLPAVRAALKNHGVLVSYHSTGNIRLHKPGADVDVFLSFRG